MPPSASSKRPTPSRSAPAKRALGVAEELALEQLARDGRAIDADQRPAAALAGVVDGARDQLLAGAGFAGDQHGGVGRRHQLDLAQDLLDRGAAPDDAVVIALDADFLLQVGVLELQPLAQTVDLLVRGAQLLVGLAPLRDVAEHDHRADHVAAVADRRRGVFDPERRAVLAPEHFGVDLMHGAVAERGVDRAIVLGIVRPVRMGVVHDRMHVVADQFLGLPAEHALGGRIDEGGLALGVDAVDAFAGGAQDQLVHRLAAEIEGDSRAVSAHFVISRRFTIGWP